MKKLFMLCGPSGIGKSTWLKNNNKDGNAISRDVIRFLLLQPGDDYFKYEDEVFERFINAMTDTLKLNNEVYIDATHLTRASRNKVFDNILRLYPNFKEDVEIHIIWFNSTPQLCKENNSKRIGIARVPDEVIDKQFRIFQKPTYFEKYKYKTIIEVNMLRNTE